MRIRANSEDAPVGRGGGRNAYVYGVSSPSVSAKEATMMDDSKYQSNRTEILFLARPSRAAACSIHILPWRCAAFITLLKLIRARKLRPVFRDPLLPWMAHGPWRREERLLEDFANIIKIFASGTKKRTYNYNFVGFKDSVFGGRRTSWFGESNPNEKKRRGGGMGGNKSILFFFSFNFITISFIIIHFHVLHPYDRSYRLNQVERVVERNNERKKERKRNKFIRIRMYTRFAFLIIIPFSSSFSLLHRLRY